MRRLTKSLCAVALLLASCGTIDRDWVAEPFMSATIGRGQQDVLGVESRDLNQSLTVGFQMRCLRRRVIR